MHMLGAMRRSRGCGCWKGYGMLEGGFLEKGNGTVDLPIQGKQAMVCSAVLLWGVGGWVMSKC